MKNYIIIPSELVKQLKIQGCSSDAWDSLYIKPTTNISKIKNVVFSGENYIGNIEGERTFYGGVRSHNVIENVHLHNCRIGDNPFIKNVESYIANYHIGDNVLIFNVGIIAVEGDCTFGNGVLVDVINEGGGRRIPIYNHLSAQVAYFLALYRHKTLLVEQLLSMIDGYIESVVSNVGIIEDDVMILNTETIKGVFIGSNTKIRSVSKLINGSINSKPDAPIYIGTDVKIMNFIISSDSVIDNASILSNCFVGQGCKIDKHYSVDHSVFFANSQGYNGEACSIFAGPYTVTHHKSTLLIAGLFSFMNAGSGSNQSNHMYKLGPVHQGIMERGAKTTSNSYVIWPSKIGPFTLVMGRHYQNVDSSDFPFSYLIESKNKSYLAPGANLKSVGIIRDAQKWPKRDSRSEKNRLDIVNFNTVSPYTMLKVTKGLKHLQDILVFSGDKLDEYTYQDMAIKKSSLHKGIGLYTKLIHNFIGNIIVSTLRKKNITTIEELRNALQPTSEIGKGKWIDVAGMLCPISKMDEFIQKVENKEITSSEVINEELHKIHKKYREYERNWALDLLERFYKVNLKEITGDQFIEIIKKWENSVIELGDFLYKDASKEFDLHTHVGFGADGNQEEKLADFKSVRGVFETNITVVDILEHIEDKKNRAHKLITLVKGIK